jgi:replication factor C subunit 2/4
MGVVGIDENGLNPSLAKGGFEAVRKAVKTVGREGWSAGQILEQVSPAVAGNVLEADQQLHDTLIPMATIPAMPKAYAALAIAECDKALCEGGDEELQLMECCLRIKEAMTRA